MKKLLHLLIWLVGVVLGVGVFFGAVIGGSYALTGESKLPDAAASVGDTPLEVNGMHWNVPLLGGMADKTFAAANTLSVQKLGTVTDAHPDFTLPDWCNYGTVTVEDEAGSRVFHGTLEEYAVFGYPANGEYLVSLTAWHLPAGMTEAEFRAQGDGPVVRNHGLETPVRPSGWYGYRVRFTLSAQPQVELSAEKVSQGSVVGVFVSGLLGNDADPAVQCDLGPVVLEAVPGGWRGYLPVAYNAEAGSYPLTVTAGQQTMTAAVKVSGKDFGRAELDTLDEPTAGGAEFREKIWPLYTAPSGGKAWLGRWSCPVVSYTVLVRCGQNKIVAGQSQGRSNSSLLVTTPGAEVTAPAGGTVAFAGDLQLTGNTVVIDHGCGVRSYLYGLGEIYVQKGDTVLQGGVLALAGQQLTYDVKIGNKSVDPWALFQGTGGLFWREDGRA